MSGFHVNLQCAEFDGCDVAFHLNPRFDLWDKVIFNTFQNGSWEGEEKVKHMPFRKGEHFELIIVVNSEGYQINVNGKDFYLFQHRMPLERVSVGVLYKDIHIRSFATTQIIQLVFCTYYFLQISSITLPLAIKTFTQTNSVLTGMQRRKLNINIKLVINLHQAFCINFVVGGSRDIAFHINPRIREGIVIRNSLIGGCWGDEERDCDFNPFLEGHNNVSKKFKVYANGQHLCTFYHRSPYSQINMLEVQGDVQVSYIHF
uniref:Galectin n=1 Tax=Astyanax mexicanus TaxID=7994 RepID=A0A8B9GUA3_ASTMX